MCGTFAETCLQCCVLVSVKAVHSAEGLSAECTWCEYAGEGLAHHTAHLRGECSGAIVTTAVANVAILVKWRGGPVGVMEVVEWRCAEDGGFRSGDVVARGVGGTEDAVARGTRVGEKVEVAALNTGGAIALAFQTHVGDGGSTDTAVFDTHTRTHDVASFC